MNQQQKKKTKWITIVRDGDEVTIGNIKITKQRDDGNSRHRTSISIEAPQDVKINKQERDSSGNTEF